MKPEKGNHANCRLATDFDRHNGIHMALSKKHHARRRSPVARSRKKRDFHYLVHPDDTGSETNYLKTLVDSHAKVTVVLKSGERLRGHIRYYDRYCFSVGLSIHGPRMFIRKENVSYISEE